MKRLLLTCGILVTAIAAQAQVIFYVQSPAGLTGNYEINWAEPGPAPDWGTPDLTDPANAIVDTLMFVDDGSAGDSLGCNILVNDLTGKIAVVYRGDCQFGTKALNAQNAGAVGVVIINNVAGAPVGMAAGDDGSSVTIPVVMISMDAGALLKSAIAGGMVTAFIGTKEGYFANDIGFTPPDILLPPAFAIPQTVAMDDTEWSVKMGTWVRNYGTVDQLDVTVNVDISLSGSSLYNETATVDSLNSGDSVFVTLPDFSEPSYTVGYYNLTYTLGISGGADDFPDDNTFPANFYLSDSLLAFVPIDEVTMMPISTAHYRSSTAGTVEFSSCIHFRDPNASRMEAVGLTATASGGSNDSLTGEPVEARLYEWNDQFSGIFDSNIAFNNLNEVGYGTYLYLSDLQNERIYIPFDQPVPLKDDQRYLFCFTTLSEGIFQGYNTTIDHVQNLNEYEQPISIVNNPVASPNTWFFLGFGTEVTPSIGARIRSTLVGVQPNEDNTVITPYPNPTNSVIHIPYSKLTGEALLDITDIMGRTVGSQQLSLDGSGQVSVDVSGISAGTYVFSLSMKDGSKHAFNVVISR